VARCCWASLLATTVSIVLLIAPAAYHRLAEHGEDTEHFHRVASRLLLAALVFLPPGMCGDLWLVLQKIGFSAGLASGLASGMLIAFWALWFGASALRRHQR
jgi:Na+/proline symporter